MKTRLIEESRIRQGVDKILARPHINLLTPSSAKFVNCAFTIRVIRDVARPKPARALDSTKLIFMAETHLFCFQVINTCFWVNSELPLSGFTLTFLGGSGCSVVR